MKQHKSLMAAMALAGVFGVASVPVAAEEVPRVRLSTVPLQSVQIDDPFWSPKYSVWRQVTISDCLNKFEKDGTLANFDFVARGELTGEHRGAPWFDGLLYEMIQGATDLLATKPDPALKARLHGYIDRVAAAAARDPDGYLNTYTQLKEPNHRWGQNGGNDRFQHDLYNLGCMIDAGVHYYRATGETKLLATAVRAANYMCKVIGPSPKQNVVPGHAMPEEAMVHLVDLIRAEPELKQKLGVPVTESDYLALAKFWFDARGNHQGRTDFGAYNQDAVTALKQETIEGHAVRAALFSSGMIAYGMSAESPQYIDVASKLWKNMVGRRMYITGGIGSFADDEKFGPDYVLPNDGYLETCAAIANSFFSHNLSLATGESAGIDELERALYNNALAGVSLAGNEYFYENPLECSPKRKRWDWHGCPCCPPMFLKLVGAMPTYIYSTDTQAGIYVNLFVGSTAKVKAGGTDVTLKQTTRYPWNGDVRVSVEPATTATFDIYVRVPAWTRGGESFGGLYRAGPGEKGGFTVDVNGTPVAATEMVRGYARLHREWKAGDTVDIRMAMPVQRVAAHENVESDRGRVALMRGPLVYTFEAVDNGENLDQLHIPNDAAITATDRSDLFGGVTALLVKAQRTQTGGGSAPVDLVAIPYYTNANRGPTEMKTWMTVK